jgi:hypothetical protein
MWNIGLIQIQQFYEDRLRGGTNRKGRVKEGSAGGYG